MKNILTTAMLVAASASGALAEANLINGNWYGKPVDKIVYTGWGQSGTYNKVTDMTNGQCKFEKVNYNGNLAPLNGEVSPSSPQIVPVTDTQAAGFVALQRSNASEAVRVLHTRFYDQAQLKAKSTSEEAWARAWTSGQSSR